MKLLSLTPRSQAGSVLLVSLITAAILGTILASYLILTQTQNISVIRSQHWNSAIALAEGGVEEALSHLNRFAPYFDPADATNTLVSNGWTYSGGRLLSPRRYLGQDYYDATIQFIGATPVIYSTGTVAMASCFAAAPQAMFATVGEVPTSSGPTYRSRAVRAETKIDSLFSVAMAAKDTIDLKGNNVSTDSFDSADPNYSTNGLYPSGQLNKTKDNGDVCTDAVIVDSLSVGNANIKGEAKTGPGGTITIGPQGTVGSKAWVEGGNRGIQPGWSANDFNVSFPDVSLPSNSWLGAPPGGTINGITYDHVFLSSGDYQVCSFNKIYIGTNATVRIKIANNIKLTGNSDQIRIAPVGASLKLYMDAASFSIKGQGVVNESGNAANFYYFGTTNNTSVNFGGNANFTGAIYAPQAAFSLGGGGNNAYDFVGASVTRTVDMNGHFNFHYDENLARVGGHRGFVPTRWTEQ